MKEQIIQLPNNFEVKEIKDGKIILVEKEKKLTYENIAKELFSKPSFYITTLGTIEYADALDNCTSELNNCTSKRQAEKLFAFNKLMNVAKYLNGDWQPNWHNNGESKCYIQIFNDEIVIASVVTVNFGDVYFKSKELAEQAIEILGEETIKLAFCTDY